MNIMNCDSIFYAKTDLSNAFRILGLKRSSFRWVLMQATDPKTGEVKIFIEKALSFGGSISCSHFQHFSNCLKHIVEYFTSGPKLWLVNYLDDFLFLQTTRNKCEELVRFFINLCEWLGVPVVMDKTEMPDEMVVFLGILLDGKTKLLCLPLEKRFKAINLLRQMLSKRKAIVKEMERLAGFLNFLTRAIFPGRVFTRRMYSKFTLISETRKLRDYHHVTLDREFKQDCQVWLNFLERDDMTTVCRLFVDLKKSITAQELDFYSDASGSLKCGGMGAYFGKSWIAHPWNKSFLKNCNPSIEYLELTALTVCTWAH